MMEAMSGIDWTDSMCLDAVERDCSWCGTRVPLPAGELCGVCIDCGTVVFRDTSAAGEAGGGNAQPRAAADL